MRTGKTVKGAEKESMLFGDRILNSVRSIQVPLQAKAFKKWLFLYPEALLTMVGLPIFFLISILLDPALIQFPAVLLLAYAVSFLISTAAGLLFYIRSRNDIDSYFQQITDPYATAEEQRASYVNRLILLPFRFLLHFAVRMILLAIISMAIYSFFIGIHRGFALYGYVRFLAQALIASHLALLAAFHYQRILIQNLLNQTRFLNVAASLIKFTKLRLITTLTIYLSIGILSGLLVFLVRAAGGYWLFEEELRYREVLRYTLQMRLDDRFQAMEAQCRQADSLLEKDATEEEIRQLSVRGGLTPKYIVQWMDGKVKGGLPSLPAFDVWKDRPFYMDVIYENDEAFFLAACQSNKTLHATGLLYPQSAVISDLETILPAEFSIVLTSTDRRIVYHRDTSKIRKTIDSLNDVIFEKKADGLEVIYYSENHVRHMLIGPQQSAGLSLLLLTSREKMEEKIDRLLVYTAITMLLLTVVYAIVVYLLLFFTLGGLRGLTDQVIQLTSGDLQAQSGYITSDSLGRLSLHLKELTEKLRTIIMNIRFTTDMIYKLNQKNVEYTKKSHDQFQSISVNVEEISSTTEEISTSFDEINHRTQAHIQNIEEYLESIQRLTTATMQMNETVNQLSSLYTSTRSEASIGRSLLKELKEAMRSLDERANRIEGIVGFINDISKQVNLLALNASIEAARAGDAGRGFAVVADEVSRLADRISESVKNISSLVQGNREESKRSYENVTEAARLFNRVLVDMNMINDVIEEIGRLRSELSETNQYVAGQNQEINVIIKFIAQISKENKNSMYEIAVELESIMKLIQNHMNQEAELRDQAATLLNYGTEINEIMKFFKSSELDVESEERSKTETDAGFSAD